LEKLLCLYEGPKEYFLLRVVSTSLLIVLSFFAVESSARADAPSTATPAPQATATVAPQPTATPEPLRRGQPAPMDAIFPSADFGGPLIGVNVDPTGLPLEDAIYKSWPALNKERIRVYGWVDAGAEYTNSKTSTYPISYNPVPDKPQLDQAILRIERDPDTVQTSHSDWGFRISNMYGDDYRFTTALGYFSQQLLVKNQLNGYDNPEAFAMLYEPHIAQGTVFELGRVISAPDIEAQLAPQNYLYSHSIMFTFDCYTQTGLFALTKLSDMFSIDAGVHAGDDVAPWTAGSRFPTAELFLKYVTKSNRNYVLAGVDSYNDRPFSTYIANGQLNGHDNLQQQNVTWNHIFNAGFHNQFEAYHLNTRDAYTGGTINIGPVQYSAGGGAGTYLPGASEALGLVDYLEKKISPAEFASFRLDYLNDPRGWRSGYATSYGSVTLGVTHKFTPYSWIRPEYRYERAFTPGVTPYDSGTERYQKSLGVDFLQFF